MIRRLTPLAAVAATVAVLAGCTSGRNAEPSPSTTPVSATTPPPPATTAAVSTTAGTTAAASTGPGPLLITAPTTTAPAPIQERPDTTVRVGVFAAEGGDGLGDDDGTDRYPAFDAFDISPLPAAITDEQGRTDPAAVARQWAGLKVLTSQIMDGPLWPYSVGRHLPALSDPTGQFIADGRLQRAEILEQSQPDAQTAIVTIAVDADNPSDETLHVVYDIELWRSDDGYWLVAFADLTAA